MGWKHLVLATKSTVLFLAAAAVVLFIRLVWMEWSGDFTMAFLRTGRIGELVFLFVVGAVIAVVFNELLKWQFRAETRPKPHPRRRRR